MLLIGFYQKITSTLFEIKQLEWCSTFFKASSPIVQDAIITKTIQQGKNDLLNHLIGLISLEHDAERAGKFATEALTSGRYLLAHDMLHRQTYAMSHISVPAEMIDVPTAEDVYSKEKMEGLKATQTLWEVRAESTDNDLLFLNALPDEITALIALYLQAPLRKNITPEQRQSLVYFGYRPAVTLSLPDKSNTVRISSKPAN